MSLWEQHPQWQQNLRIHESRHLRFDDDIQPREVCGGCHSICSEFDIYGLRAHRDGRWLNRRHGSDCGGNGPARCPHQLHINPTNLGDYPNRNQAASHATGKYLKYVDADDLIYPWGLQILWDCMEQFPEARWGLCSLAQDRERPFPFQLNPAEAYRYHYLGPGLFNKAPLSSIIRRDLFEEVGGFRPFSHAGDFEMWNRLAMKMPVVLMAHGVVWYREHDDQSSNTQHLHVAQYDSIRTKYLDHPDCPLNAEELTAIQQKRKRAKQKAAFLRLGKKLIPRT